MVTDFQLSMHLVMGEWVVLVRGRLLNDDDGREWVDVLRAQLEQPDVTNGDPWEVLAGVLAQLT